MVGFFGLKQEKMTIVDLKGLIRIWGRIRELKTDF